MEQKEKHLTQEALEAFHNNQLDKDSYLQLLEHTSHCTYCADLFAASFHQARQLSAPPQLKENILLKASRTRILKPVLPWNVQKNRQLFFYSLKVCAAMCGALMIMVSSMNVSYDRQDSAPVHSILEDINSSMRGISDKMNQQMNSFITGSDRSKNVKTNSKQASPEESTTNLEVK